MSIKAKENKTIAKNTLFLYIKLFVSTIIGLYTSRLVLDILGVSDFGLYTVVGGLAIIMNFLGGVLTSTSYRFIAVELGKKDGNPNNIYNTVLIVHYTIALLLLIIGESIGMYYIEHYLNIETSKIDDATFILHWAILSTTATIISIPSSGLIIAKEKFLYTSIIEIVRNFIRLGLIIYLSYYSGNVLRMYSIINFIFMSIIPISSIIYCKIKFKDITKFKFNKKWNDYKNVIIFAGWSTFGAGSLVALNQGNAIILNFFLSTAINAAYGLANQINGYVMMFVKNIGQAAVPQIMKQYSAGNSKESIKIVYNIAKFSFFFILFPSIPCLICMDRILELWLVNVPQYTALFASLVILSNFFWCISVGFDSTIQASGNIKYYQIFFSIINLSMLPLNYFLLKKNIPPYYIILNTVLANFFIWILQIYFLYRMQILKLKEYLHITIVPCFKVLLLVSPLFLISNIYAIKNFLDICIITSINVIYIFVAEFFGGISKKNRIEIINNLKRKWK